MGGYLEGYGTGEEHREKLLKRIGLIALVVVVITGSIYFAFHNFSQKQTVKHYLALLQSGDYHGAYAMWQADARNYPFETFMQDWGPKSAYASASSLHIDSAESCGSGVVFSLGYPGRKPVPLWVERSTGVVSFAPWPQCPGRHWRVLAFVKSLFGDKNQDQ